MLRTESCVYSERMICVMYCKCLHDSSLFMLVAVKDFAKQAPRAQNNRFKLQHSSEEGMVIACWQSPAEEL